MSNFNYNTPDDFNKDEEKWFKFFSIWSLISTIIFTTIAGVIFIPATNKLNNPFLGILLTGVFGFIGFAIVRFEIPVGSKFPGAGHTPIVLIMRVLIRRRKKNRVIYVKGYGEYEGFNDDEEM